MAVWYFIRVVLTVIQAAKVRGRKSSQQLVSKDLAANTRMLYSEPLDMESNEYRGHDSNSCPYYRQLDQETNTTEVGLKELKLTSAQGCQFCTILVEAIRLFSKKVDQDSDCAVDIREGYSGLWDISMNDKPIFQMFTLPIPLGRKQQLYVGSKANLDLIMPWINACSQNHLKCNSQGEQFMPARVLDVGIPWLTLPATFRDAVKLTRYLGIRYLWIDCLCIIQDDTQDWVNQSPQMSNIYGGSFLTISATVSVNSTEGIFRRVSHSAGQIEVPDPLILGASTGLFVRSYRYVAHDQFRFLTPTPGDGREEWDYEHPLLRRAWAYQEQLLSPRVLFCGHHELYWQCNQELQCYCSTRVYRFDGIKAMFADVIREERECTQPWQRIVELYSGKDITHEQDRLPALSGIAQRFQVIRGSQYLAGLWKDNLIHDLCWHVAEYGRRPQSYLAPSWSWCSVLGKVSHLSRWVNKDHIDIQSSVCIPTTSNPTGSVSSGHICVTGYLATGKPSVGFSDAFEDDQEAIQRSKGTAFGLRLGSGGFIATKGRTILLLLFQPDGMSTQFKRFGIAMIDTNKWINVAEERREITII
ncbi:hypothetical protein BT63DRAFT_411923 [Microthyrium microscopicum]|uniref:Heterokaryon incompatibility domain-containing protein n=1 Tax=Microthyrium microscopicum TaxID=703497 RepID=A0A6A6UEX7_9PEZI|nr:hypothetical protein BT63DRAFT_411923 [Microthyrium microscopicum]